MKEVKNIEQDTTSIETNNNKQDTTSIETNNNKNNKKIKIFLYIMVFVVAITGLSIAIYEQNQEKQEYKEQQEYEENEEKQEQEEPTEDETSENTEEPEAEIEEKQEENIENQQDDSVYPYPLFIDDLVLQSKSIKMTTELREDLINSTNAFTSFLGEIFKEEISNEFKLFYTIEAYTNQFAFDDDVRDWGCISHIVKRETLLKYAKMLFADVEIPSKFSSKKGMGLISDLTCDEVNCTYFLACGREGRPDSEILTQITHNGEVSIVRAFYGEYNWSLDDYDVIENITLYDKYNGKKLATIKNFNIDDAGLNYDTLSKYITNQNDIPTYEFKFDDQNRLVSVKRVDK